MPNLIVVSNIFKKYAWIIAILAVIISIIGLIVLKLYWQDKSGKKQLDTSASINKPVLRNLNIKTGQFNIQDLKLPDQYPKTLPIVKKTADTNLLVRDKEIAQKLGFSSPAGEFTDAAVGKKMYYSNPDSNLSLFKNGFSYTQYSTKAQPSPTNKTNDDLRNEIVTFISNLSLATNFSQESKFIYYQSLGEFETITKDPNLADQKVVIFSYEISGVRVVGTQAVTSATFDKQNRLISINYYQLDTITSPQNKNYPIIPPKDAINKLVGRQASIIDVQTPGGYFPPPNQISNINIVNMHLAYYLSSSNVDSLQPVWIFEGNTIVKEKEISLTYAVPAIEEKYYKK